MTIKDLKNEEPAKDNQIESGSPVPQQPDEGSTEQVHFTHLEDLTTRLNKVGDFKER